MRNEYIYLSPNVIPTWTNDIDSSRLMNSNWIPWTVDINRWKLFNTWET